MPDAFTSSTLEQNEAIRGFALAKVGQTAAAERAFYAAEAQHRNHASATLAWDSAKIAMLHGEDSELLKVVTAEIATTIPEKSPSRTSLLVYVATLLPKLPELEKLKNWLSQWRKYTMGNDRIMMARTMVQIRTGASKEAAAEIESALKGSMLNHKENYVLRLLLVRAYRELGRMKDAEKTWAEYMELMSKNPGTYWSDLFYAFMLEQEMGIP